MKTQDIPRLRLRNQRLAGRPFQRAEQVVDWLGAVQAQDFYAAKWAVAGRTRGLTDAEVEHAFDEGLFLRTHVLRPTWHFVMPADIRWMLALTAPRVHAAMASQRRQLGLDAAMLRRSNAALIKTLQGGRQMTKAELVPILERAGIDTNLPLRVIHVLMHAELDGVLCSGAKRGKQQTYALLEERVPPAQAIDRDEALARLAMRYFASHGPAAVADFSWWSGLTSADARAGLESVKSGLAQAELEGQAYWFAESAPAPKRPGPQVHLLASFDEYVVGYTDRRAVFDTAHRGKLGARGDELSAYTIVIDGRIAGSWKRTLRKDSVLVELNPLAPLTKAESRGVRASVERYAAYLDLPLQR